MSLQDQLYSAANRTFTIYSNGKSWEGSFALGSVLLGEKRNFDYRNFEISIHGYAIRPGPHIRQIPGSGRALFSPTHTALSLKTAYQVATGYMGIVVRPEKQWCPGHVHKCSCVANKFIHNKWRIDQLVKCWCENENVYFPASMARRHLYNLQRIIIIIIVSDPEMDLRTHTS